MNFLAVIPARGGSKGIPRKNLQLVNNKPLIGLSVEQVLGCSKVQDHLVSTDDEEIAAMARSFGGYVPELRPRSLAGDHTSSADVLFYILKQNPSVRHIVLLQPTTPFRTSKDIDLAIELYEDLGLKYDLSKTTLISGYDAESVHPEIMHRQDENDFFCKFSGEKDEVIRRQEFERTFVRNGAIYIIPKKLILEKKVLSEKVILFEMPERRSLNIDQPWDLEKANLLYSTVMQGD